MSTVLAYYHAVISTRYRQITIDERNKQELYAYIAGIMKKMSCQPIIINGIGNHIHLLFNLHQSTRLSDLMKEIKRSSSLWMKSVPEKFPRFQGWGKEYAAFAVSFSRKQQVIAYIKDQEAHHHRETFDQELQRFVLAHEMPFRPYQTTDDD